MRDNSAGRVEAVRYALSQRLTPAIRHGLAGKLHPISLLAESLARRLRASPDTGQIRDSLEKFAELARSAISGCAILTSWLSPADDQPIAFGQGVEECVALLGTDLGMRGYAINSRVGGVDAMVSKSAIRQVLAAALIAQSDGLARAADLQLIAEASPGFVNLEILVLPGERAPGVGMDEVYRLLEWEEVALLAKAESVGFSRDDRRVELRFPVMRSE